jgi:hypothetical protein
MASEKELRTTLFVSLATEDATLIDKLKRGDIGRTPLDRTRLIVMQSLLELEPQLKRIIKFYGE